MGMFIDTAKVDLSNLNDVNDAEVGSSIASAVQPRFGGMLGKIIALTHTQAALLSNSTIGTLYGGWYQYVKAATALARGDIVAWDVNANNGLTDYETTHTITLGHEGFLSGFALNTITINQYGWVQILGLATAKCAASVTDTTVGSIAVQLTTTATCDAIADATGSYIGGGAKGLKQIVGTWYEAPANGALKKLVMKGFPLNL